MAACQVCSRWLIGALVAVGVGAGAGRAAADSTDARIASYEVEAQKLGLDLPRPNRISIEAGQRRLLDAQIAFALGDYDGAAVLLFELAAKPGADREAASFYLAESLFHKSDRGAARGYYEHIVSGGTVASKYYQPSLVRLIEIAIASRDEAGAAAAVALLDRVPPAQRLPDVPYVRGKLAYSQGKPDDAIALFQEVPKGSAYELPATYFTATAYVVKKDLQRATDIFTDLAGRTPRSPNDRRIVELAQLGLGRLYYERDQPSKSIDSYLLVDRHSDLFADALYEVGWVYVKSKQYDKALRALELLSLADPASTRTPTVRILEGNLRIRKAQMIRAAQIAGTLDNRSTDNPATEYDKAVQLFTETHDLYLPSYAALAQITSANADPAQYLNQIAGRFDHVFQAAAPIPEAAVQYMRDEPEVQRVVAVETDLGDITANLAVTETTIARLEGMLATGDSSGVYPALASRRARLGAIERELIKIRSALADQELELVAAPPASAARKKRFAAYQAMPDPQQAQAARLAQRDAELNALEDKVMEIDAAIGSTQATAVALRKYSIDTAEMPVDQKRATTAALDEAARDAQAIENELARVRKELQLGRDLAGLDESAAAVRETHKQLKAAEDAEHQQLVALASTSRDHLRSLQLVAQAERATHVAEQVDQINQQIDGMVDLGLREIRAMVTEAKATLDAYKAELDGYETEARTVGGGVLGATFKGVKAKLYDIVVRTDVGNVDVAWSQREDTDDDLKRLNLSRQRELKQLRDEFKDILDGGTQKPSVPAKKLEVPRPEQSPPTGSPDKGAGDQRIAPGSERPAPAAPPAVRPEDAKTKPDASATTKKTPKKAAKTTAPKGSSR